MVHAVEGIPGGTYQYHPQENVLERIGETGTGSPADTSSSAERSPADPSSGRSPREDGGSRETAGHLALDQPVVGDAAVTVYLLADVETVVERLGNRGYRLAQLEGGLVLGRLYLATYAHLGLGERGFTFYDDLVTHHLSPRAANGSPMTMFAFGKADR